MNYFAIITSQRVVFVSTEQEEKELRDSLTNTLTHLVTTRLVKLRKNDQFINPDKYPDLEESKRPTRLLLVLNEYFKLGKEEFLLSEFFDFEKKEVLSYKIKKIDLNA